MSQYRAYPAYKDSGIEWIGQVPEHWEVKPFKYILSAPMSYGANESAESDDPNHPRYIRITDLTENGTLREDTFKTLPWDKAYSYLLSDGDILLARSGATVGKSFLYRETNGAACFAGYLIKASCDEEKALPKYIYAYLQSHSYWEYISGSNIQSTIQNVSAEKYSSMVLPVPQREEQATIAATLDRETARIDTLVEKKTRFIELLKEKRQALITHAVTKGLDPNVKMKDSGVEWIGQVPEHWEATKLKHVAAFSGGGTPSKENPDYWNGCIPWVSPKDMKHEVITDSIDHITTKGLENSATKLIDSGAVLLVARSGILRHTIPVGINNVPVSLNQDMKALSLDETRVRPRFILRWVQGLNRSLLGIWAKEGATVESLEHEYVANTRLPLPDLKEQDAILATLDLETARIDALISKAEQSITLLKERRAAFITAAVTGQIDLRGKQ
ncbi:restriction endonuclease subunit S [Lelliottia sp. SL45]|uniref:restriction endonuclease subunit S n=1 Tax=Lelliottia sp. SL45 TaxID=2994665 RepID=UPI002272700F|nr:restriction endonuclease subunit S [Lelliottia sp. SL45]MCY1700889.1 restriction endonuclease subunit S [Lelliottia sp. SL45]